MKTDCRSGRLARVVRMRRGEQRGVTLVELLVALTVSLVLVLAAITLYTTTSSSQRSLDQLSEANESGAFALRTLGRDLANAGFYPTVRGEDPANLNAPSHYTNLTGQAAYDTGLFGCEGAAFNPTTGACGASVAGAPDALVIGYFTSDAFGTQVGQRADCEGNDSVNAAVNTARNGSASAGVPPAQPLFVANRYQLTSAQTTSVDGRTSATRSLACDGNGTTDGIFSPLVAGIEDLQLSYGVFADESRIPSRFYTATEVSALGTAVIGTRSIPAWERVVAVRVCVIARTYQSATAIAATASPPTYQDCNDATVTNASGDTSLRKTYVQVFGVRNRQSGTY
jgi:type IV pilus assembly protein PilW